MNTFTITGNICNELKLKVGEKQKKYLHIQLADNQRYRKNNDKSNFFWLVAFGSEAENAATYLDKGSLITANCHIENNNRVDENGNTIYQNTILVNRIEYLDARVKQKAPADNAKQNVGNEKNDSASINNTNESDNNLDELTKDYLNSIGVDEDVFMNKG